MADSGLHGWRIASLEDLSPGPRRALLSSLGVRCWQNADATAARDLFLGESQRFGSVPEILGTMEQRSGFRVPLLMYPGSPAVGAFLLRDIGGLASWYFQILEEIHDRGGG